MVGELGDRVSAWKRTLERDVRPGPAGRLYLLTDDTHGAVLRLEPAP